MLEVNSRKRFKIIRLKDIHYATRVHEKHPGYDVVYYFNCQQPSNRAKEFKTMVIDLTRDPKEILDSFCKKTRAQVKKALSNEALDFSICEEPETDDLDNYYRAYDHFARQKHILPCHKDLLGILCAENRLRIASASSNGETLCQFAVIELEDKMVCYHGYNIRFSCLDDPEKVKLISQANRALEYHCMLYAKEKGKIYYDFCGLTLDPNNNQAANVDHYKKGFKGDIVTEYHLIAPITKLGAVFCFFVHLKRNCGYFYHHLRHGFR